MAAPYLIDSNVFIEYTSKKFSGLAEQKLDDIFNNQFHYSIISRMEVLGYGKASPNELQNLSYFLSFGIIHEVGLLICDKVIEMRRALTKKNTPDLIIAATAMVNNCTLLTNNTKDFKNIPGLNFETPWDWQ
jgi:predicted nucleic acid-binding protein